jgi:hypothetical protein
LHGAYFDVFSGRLKIRNRETGQFDEVIESGVERVSLFDCR